MACGELPRVPIVALSGLSADETHLTALALGCDAVVEKSAPLDLPARIKAALEPVRRSETDPTGFDAMLRLIRLQLDRKNRAPAPHPPVLTAADINTALLAYRRHGCLGLGESALARYLSPHVSNPLRRGEYAYAQIMRCLDELMRLSVCESAMTLRGELERNLAPAAHQAQLALSKTTYYRQRQEAALVLVELLARACA